MFQIRFIHVIKYTLILITVVLASGCISQTGESLQNEIELAEEYTIEQSIDAGGFGTGKREIHIDRETGERTIEQEMERSGSSKDYKLYAYPEKEGRPVLMLYRLAKGYGTTTITKNIDSEYTANSAFTDAPKIDRNGVKHLDAYSFEKVKSNKWVSNSSNQIRSVRTQFDNVLDVKKVNKDIAESITGARFDFNKRNMEYHRISITLDEEGRPMAINSSYSFRGFNVSIYSNFSYDREKETPAWVEKLKEVYDSDQEKIDWKYEMNENTWIKTNFSEEELKEENRGLELYIQDVNRFREYNQGSWRVSGGFQVFTAGKSSVVQLPVYGFADISSEHNLVISNEKANIVSRETELKDSGIHVRAKIPAEADGEIIYVADKGKNPLYD